VNNRQVCQALFLDGLGGIDDRTLRKSRRPCPVAWTGMLVLAIGRYGKAGGHVQSLGRVLAASRLWNALCGHGRRLFSCDVPPMPANPSGSQRIKVVRGCYCCSEASGLALRRILCHKRRTWGTCDVKILDLCRASSADSAQRWRGPV
jgi:hypothetical protein